MCGNLTRIADPNGAVTTLEYDAENRLVRFTNAEGLIINYEHDALGRIIRMHDNSGREMRYTYYRGRLVSQTDVLRKNSKIHI